MTITTVELIPPVGAARWLRISRYYDSRKLRWVFMVSFYDGEPDSSGSSTVQLCGKKRSILTFRDINEDTITSEIIARVRLDSGGRRDNLSNWISLPMNFEYVRRQKRGIRYRRYYERNSASIWAPAISVRERFFSLCGRAGVCLSRGKCEFPIPLILCRALYLATCSSHNNNLFLVVSAAAAHLMHVPMSTIDAPHAAQVEEEIPALDFCSDSESDSEYDQIPTGIWTFVFLFHPFSDLPLDIVLLS